MVGCVKGADSVEGTFDIEMPTTTEAIPISPAMPATASMAVMMIFRVLGRS
jgi:hypothetical protein